MLGLHPAPTSAAEEDLAFPGRLVIDEDYIYGHPEFTPVERLRHLMEEYALTWPELARRAVSSLSDILSHRVHAKSADCFVTIAGAGISSEQAVGAGVRSLRRVRVGLV